MKEYNIAEIFVQSFNRQRIDCGMTVHDIKYIIPDYDKSGEIYPKKAIIEVKNGTQYSVRISNYSEYSYHDNMKTCPFAFVSGGMTKLGEILQKLRIFPKGTIIYNDKGILKRINENQMLEEDNKTKEFKYGDRVKDTTDHAIVFYLCPDVLDPEEYSIVESLGGGVYEVKTEYLELLKPVLKDANEIMKFLVDAKWMPTKEGNWVSQDKMKTFKGTLWYKCGKELTREEVKDLLPEWIEYYEK